MSVETKSQEKLCVVIVEGLGFSSNDSEDAYREADAPTIKKLEQSVDSSFVKLNCNGYDIGLNKGKAGTAGLSYLTLGTGSITKRQLFIFNEQIDDGSFFKNQKFIDAIEKSKSSTGRIHFIGQITDSYEETCLKQIDAILKMCQDNGANKVYFHGILGDKDEEPKIGADNVAKVEKMMEEHGVGEFSTLCGSIYAYSEKEDWQYIKQYYECITNNKGRHCEGKASEYITKLYEAGEQDETMSPIYCSAEGKIQDNDVVIFFNSKASSCYRALIALTFMSDAQIKEQNALFSCEVTPAPSIYTFVYFSASIPNPVLFEQEFLKKSILDTLSKNDTKTALICEKNRETFASFLFSGSQSNVLPKNIASYVSNSIAETVEDPKQELSMKSIAYVAKQLMLKNKYSCLFVSLNSIGLYASLNDFNVVKTAIESTDKIVKNIYDTCKFCDYRFVFVSTDCSGNLINKENLPLSTLSEAGFYIQQLEGEELHLKNLDNIRVSNVANTLLTLLKIDNEKEMDESLL